MNMLDNNVFYFSFLSLFVSKFNSHNGFILGIKLIFIYFNYDSYFYVEIFFLSSIFLVLFLTWIRAVYLFLAVGNRQKIDYKNQRISNLP